MKSATLALCLLSCGCLSIFMPITPGLIDDPADQRGTRHGPSQPTPGQQLPSHADLPCYKAGHPPRDLERRRQRLQAVLDTFPPGGRVSRLRQLFPRHQNIGTKTITNLSAERWEIDDAFFIAFETEPGDIAHTDPRVSRGPVLRSYTYGHTPAPDELPEPPPPP